MAIVISLSSSRYRCRRVHADTKAAASGMDTESVAVVVAYTVVLQTNAARRGRQNNSSMRASRAYVRRGCFVGPQQRAVAHAQRVVCDTLTPAGATAERRDTSSD